MKISAKVEYASLAMFELALHHGRGEPVRIRDIADKHDIPSRFLVQILLQLKGAGLVTSTRGASGGYQLARRPDEISLDDIVLVIEGPAEAYSEEDTVPTTAPRRVLHSAWRDAGLAQRETLQAVTLADLVEQARTEAGNMYYI